MSVDNKQFTEMLSADLAGTYPRTASAGRVSIPPSPRRTWPQCDATAT